MKCSLAISNFLEEISNLSQSSISLLWSLRKAFLSLLAILWHSAFKWVHPKGDQSWVFIGRTDIEAETPILCPPDVKNWLIGKALMLGKIERKKEKGMTEDEMTGWHHWINGMCLSKLREIVKDMEPWHAAVHAVTKSQTWLSDWTTIKTLIWY